MMLRRACLAALAALLVLGSATPGMAKKPKGADGKKQITNSIGMKLVLIPPGEFTMGSPESAEEIASFFNKGYYAENLMKPSHFNGEYPQHHIRITKSFYLGAYEVTRGQFKQFVQDTRYKTDAEKSKKGALGFNSHKENFEAGRQYSWMYPGFEQTDEHPVVNVSWNDAMAFCKWLSRKDRKAYRLPTEAQWEYACRAGTTTRYCNGDAPEMLAKVCNFGDATAVAKFPCWGYVGKASDGYVYTSSVGSFQPNVFGLYDMHGNVWEWCVDFYDAEYYAVSPVKNPIGPRRSRCGGLRVLRSGSWGAGPSNIRSSKRGADLPDCARCDQGFRIVRIK